MKKILVLLVLAALGWLGYLYIQDQGGFNKLIEKFRPDSDRVVTEPEHAAEKATEVTGQDQPHATVVEERPLLAPEGVYYLVSRQSIVTDSGVAGYEAGTQVRLVRREGSQCVVKTANHELTLPESALTNDLRKLDAITKSQQAALAARQLAAHQQMARQATASAQQDQQLAATADARQNRELEARKLALRQQIAAARSRSDSLRREAESKRSDHYHARLQGKSSSQSAAASRLEGQARELDAKAAQWEAELSSLP